MNIFKGKYKIWLLIAIVAIIFVIPQFGLAAADIGKAIAEFIATVVLHIVNFLVGWLVSLLIKVFVAIAQYNQFINSAAVSKGWIIIRDVFNMFFVIALLIIAFSTVLGIQKYHYKQILVSLLIAAVLVNFSKLICGIFIDISQVLMLTFVRAFQDVAGGNLIKMMGLKGLLGLKSLDDATVGGGEILGAALLALIMATISVVVIGVIVMILIFRIVWLWFLIILSPLAFVASVFPGRAKSYSSQWWRHFIKEVIVGPVLAFCLWLSFAVVQAGGISEGINVKNTSNSETSRNSTNVENKISEAASPQYMLNFLLGIGMLVGSLMVAETLGVAGAGIAKKAKGKIEAYAKGEKGPMKKVRLAGKVAGGVAQGVGGVAGAAGKVALKAPGRLLGSILKGTTKGTGKLIQQGGKFMQKGKEGGKLHKAGEKVGKAGTFVEKKMSHPVQSIQPRMEKWIEGAKDSAEDRRERVYEGKGSIIDEALVSTVENYKSHGFSKRQALRAAHLERAKDREKEFEDQGADNSRLKNNLQDGSQVDVEAATSLMLKRGAFKNDPEALKLARKRVQAGGNRELKDKLDKNAKKTVDPDTLTESLYHGFRRGFEDFEQVLKDVENGDLDINKFLNKLSDENFQKMQDAAGDESALIELFKRQDKEGFQSTVGKLSNTKKGRERYNAMLAKADVSKIKDKKDKDEFINQNSNFIPDMSDKNFQKMQDAAEGDPLLTKLFENKSRDEFESFGKKMRKTKKGRKRLNEMIDGSDKVKGMKPSKLESEEDKKTFIKATGRLDFILPKIAIEQKYKDREKEIKESDKFKTEKERDDALKANKKDEEKEIEAIDKKGIKAIDTFVSDHKSIIMNNLSEKAVENREVVKTLLRNKIIKREDIDSLEGKIKKAFLDKLEEDLIPAFNESGDTSDVAKKARKIYAKIKKNVSTAFEKAPEALKTAIDNEDIKIGDVIKNKASKVNNKTIEVLADKLVGPEVIELIKENARLGNKVVEQRKEKKILSDVEKNSEWVNTS